VGRRRREGRGQVWGWKVTINVKLRSLIVERYNRTNWGKKKRQKKRALGEGLCKRGNREEAPVKRKVRPHAGE